MSTCGVLLGEGSAGICGGAGSPTGFDAGAELDKWALTAAMAAPAAACAVLTTDRIAPCACDCGSVGGIGNVGSTGGNAGDA